MYPTPLNPWYAVVKYSVEKGELHEVYYQAPSEMTETDPQVFTDAKHAMVFMSLQSAIRVAEACNAHIRVIYDRETYKKEFGR